MKRIFFFVLLLILLIRTAAQVPIAIPYQAVARNAAGNLIANQPISVRFSIHDLTASGTIIYREFHLVTTNNLGLFNVSIGTGTVVSGSMSTMNWAMGGKFVQVELDPTGGSNYIDMGTTQLMSVPYALHAKTVEQTPGKTYLILSGPITNAEAAEIISKDSGPNTQFLKIVGTTNLTSVNLNMFTELLDVEISGNTSLVTVTANNVTKIYGQLLVVNNPQLTQFSLPSFNKLYNSGNSYSQIRNNTSLTSVNFGNLQKIEGSLDFYGNPSLVSVNLSNLQSVGQSLGIGFCSLSTLDLHNLTTTGSIAIYDMPSLSVLNLSGLTHLTSQYSDMTIYKTNLTSVTLSSMTSLPRTLYILQNPSLTGINLPALSSMNNAPSLIFSENKLNSASVNSLLSKLASLLPFNNASIYLDRQIPTAPPTGQGVIDRNLILSGGNRVITD